MTTLNLKLSDKDIIAVRKSVDGVELDVEYRTYDENGFESTSETTVYLSKADLQKLAEV